MYIGVTQHPVSREYIERLVTQQPLRSRTRTLCKSSTLASKANKLRCTECKRHMVRPSANTAALTTRCALHSTS